MFFQTMRVDALAIEGPIKSSRGHENPIANDLGFQSSQGIVVQPSIVRICLLIPLGDHTRHPKGITLYKRADHVFDRPPVNLDKSPRQIIHQLRMRRPVPNAPEIVRGTDDPCPEGVMPEAIDHDSRSQGIFLAGDGLCHLQPTTSWSFDRLVRA